MRHLTAISLALCLVLASPAYAVQAYIVARELTEGTPEEMPNLSPPDTGKVVGGVLAHFASIGQWGLYSITGKTADVSAWIAKPTIYPLAYRTRTGQLRWAEQDETIDPAIRTRLNTWLTARGYNTIPAGWTKRQVVQALVDRFIKPRWPRFELDTDQHNDPEVD